VVVPVQSQLLKRSDHVKEWRSRYFHLHDRRIYYFECEEDAMPVEGKTFHKGYLDMVGAQVSSFTDEESETTYYGFEVLEEYGLEGDGKGSGADKGLKLRLCSEHEEQRDKWVDAIKYASRPRWIDNKEDGAAICLACEKKFGMTTRKSHCRRCGGVMCKKCTVLMNLPDMVRLLIKSADLCPFNRCLAQHALLISCEFDISMQVYEEPQKCCVKCQAGEYASRYIDKIPRKDRGNKKPKALDAGAGADVANIIQMQI
jgi:hypothetical protein